jgi:hypothetical protein
MASVAIAIRSSFWLIKRNRKKQNKAIAQSPSPVSSGIIDIILDDRPINIRKRIAIIYKMRFDIRCKGTHNNCNRQNLFLQCDISAYTVKKLMRY